MPALVRRARRRCRSPPTARWTARRCRRRTARRRQPSASRSRRATPVEERARRHLGRGAGRGAGRASTTTSSSWAATRCSRPRCVAPVREAFGVELPLRALFEAPTVGGLGGGASRRSARAADRLRADRRRSRRDGAAAALVRAGAALVPRPARAGQRRPTTCRSALRLAGPARRGRARARARRARARGTRCCAPRSPTVEGAPVPGDPTRRSGRAAGRRPRRRCRTPSAEARRAGGARRRRRPFDLARGPLLRARLLRARRRATTCSLLTMHHIVSDGWSMGVLVRELGALYAAFAAGRPSPLPRCRSSTPTTRPGSARWLHGRGAASSSSPTGSAQLAGAPAGARAARPTGRGPPVQSRRGARAGLALPRRARAEALGALARREGATLFMMLLAAFQALLSPLHAARTTSWSARRSPAATRAETRGADRLLRQHAGAARRPRRRPDVRASCSAGCGRRRSAPTPTRTCRSSGWSRSCSRSGT